MSVREPMVRYATLAGLVDLADDLGLNIRDLFARNKLDPIGLTQPDRWVSAVAVADLLEDAALRSGRDDVGLQLAERRHLSNLGPVSLVIREEPNLGAALQTLIRYNHMYNEALQTSLVGAGETTTVRIELNLGQSPPPRQSIDLAVRTLVGILAELTSTDWRPLATCFTHARPADTSQYPDALGTNLTFDHALNGIVLRSTDLEISNALADPLLLPYAQQLLSPGSGTAGSDIEGRTREVIELLLPAGRCSVEHVAQSLGVSRRTLHRQLQTAGTTFTDLLDTTREDLATHLLSNHRDSLTDVSVMLMFSTPGNFTRWFRQRFGTTPRAWRQQATQQRGAS